MLFTKHALRFNRGLTPDMGGQCIPDRYIQGHNISGRVTICLLGILRDRRDEAETLSVCSCSENIYIFELIFIET
jgi:hypothetical protein